jgi:ABC-type multidrug transport system ATPase subunit
LIHAPRVLLLDEPTTGVDPVSRKEFWKMLKKLKQQGITILVSTPYMDEAMLCDRIALIQDGSFLQVDTPQGIIGSYHQQLWAVSSEQMHPLLNDLRRQPEVQTAFSFGETYHITVSPQATTEALSKALVQAGHTDVCIRPIEPSIEDCFMALMKKEA